MVKELPAEKGFHNSPFSPMMQNSQPELLEEVC
jgi:hypothetical protein